ncbi:MAG: aldo/keto reductase [Coriobacteriales bacterium]
MEDYLGKDIPKLGFGLMRLPRKGDKPDDPIDIEQVKQMVDEFLAAGFTYFDTARVYSGSEAAIKEALVDRYPRDSYQLATKNASWIDAKNADEAKAMFDKSLEETGAGYFDFYLLHNVGAGRTKVFDDFGMWDFIVQKKKEGLVKHVGFSFHDQANVLDQVLNEHDDIVEFVQLQVNYADWNAAYVQSGKCFETARKHGKPVVIMEPVKGGMLADPPAPVKKILKEANPDASCASWALRFVAELDGVITILSGMSNIEQMRDNIATFKDIKPLSASEREVIKDAQNALANMGLVECTGCRYCTKGCPKNINIPAVFSAVNMYRMFGDLVPAKNHYNFETGGIHASECIQCGQCENACPQGLPIIKELADASKLFDVDDEKAAK